jgi:hypothetical protein
MMVADVFVILDSVQFNPRHEENRARIKTPRGPEWLTVPMRQAKRDQLIRDTFIDNSQPWQKKALGTLQHMYGKAPCYSQYAPAIRSVLEMPCEALTHLDRLSWQPAIKPLGITCQFVHASELPVTGRGPQLLLDICKYVGADTYLSGAFGRDYLDTAEFAREGVDVLFHEYDYAPYPQCHEGFIPFLSYLDLLLNRGLDRDFVHQGGHVASFETERVAP